MTDNEEIYEEDDFIIYLTIDGTSYEEVEVKVDPFKTIRAQIASIVGDFELPKRDNGGRPIEYLLGQIMEDGEDLEVLQFEDEKGRDQALIDFNIQPRDHLRLVCIPIPGTRYAYLYYVYTKQFGSFSWQVLRKYSSGSFDRFATSYYVSERLSDACMELNLDEADYDFYQVKRTGFKDVTLKRLPSFNPVTLEKTYLDEFFDDEDYTLTEMPMLVLMPSKKWISKRIYNKIKKEYNDKRRNLWR